MCFTLLRNKLTKSQKYDVINTTTVTMTKKNECRSVECFSLTPDHVRVPLCCHWNWISEVNKLPLRYKPQDKKNVSFSLYNGKKQVENGVHPDQAKYQEELMKEAMNIIGNCANGKGQIGLTFALSTGYGKTAMGIWISVVELGYKTMVMCYNTEILNQWKKRYESAGVKVQLLSSSNEELKDDVNIYICGVFMAGNIDWERTSQIGCVIVDECHLATEAIVSKSLFNFDPHVLIFLSATPDRKDGLDKSFSLYCKSNVIVGKIKKDYDIIKCNTGIIPDTSVKTVINGRETFSYVPFLSSVYNDSRYLSIISKVIDHILNLEKCKKLYVIVYRSDTAKGLSKNYANTPHGTIFGSKKSKMTGEERLVIASDKKGSVGVDVDGVTHVLIGNPIKDIRQPQGRSRLMDVNLWILCHDHRTFDKHYSLMRDYIKENAIENGFREVVTNASDL